MKYAWIKNHRDSFPIAAMCRVLKVSKAGYFAWRKRRPSRRSQRRECIRQAVRQVHAESHGIYGSRKIARALRRRGDLEPACRNTVAAAMREMGLRSRVRRGFRPRTTHADPSRPAAANTLDRDFTAEAPNRKWVTDITYLATAAGWVEIKPLKAEGSSVDARPPSAGVLRPRPCLLLCKCAFGR